MIRSALSYVFAASFLLAPLALAHNADPLALRPTAPAEGAEVEVLVGEVRELVVEDRVANATVRYHSLALDDGSFVRLSGANPAIAHGSRVEITGRRNGRSLFVNELRELGRAPRTGAASAQIAEVHGVLRMYHVDYLDEAQSRFEFDVLGDDDKDTQLRLGVNVDALQRGMRVIVRGPMAADDAIEPSQITILALADEPDPKVTVKAAKTDNVLVILMRFSDSPSNPFTQAQVQTAWSGATDSGGVAEYFKEVSFSQQLLNVTVTPWLSIASKTPANCAWSTMGSMGRTAANAAGYTTSSYHKIVYVFPKVSSCGWAGLGYVGGSGAWINGRNTLLVYAHELGHNFGLLHAARLDCGTAVIGGTCSVSEYGDPFNVMGNNAAMHVNAFQKADMGWIPSSAVKTHTSGSITYTLNPLETPGGSTYAVKVPAAANRTYWLEYRRPVGFDEDLASYPNNGAFIRVATPFETLCSGCDSYSNDTQLLDTTPATSTFTDAALLVGRSFTDTKYGITFNVLTVTSSALTVQVVGPGATIPVPTTTTLVSALNPSLAGISVAFTATVNGTAPTGTVTFTANGATITGCSAVSLVGSGNSRTAACATAAFLAGSHSVVARYNGDAGNPGSTSATLTQVVNATTGTNVALASAGATAIASSTYSSSYPVSSVINNERAGSTRWRDGTSGVWPDWVEVRFSGSKRIDRVTVYSVQNNWSSPVEPSATLTGSTYVLKDFTVQGWNGSTWVTLATVSGNNLIKRNVTFSSFTTDRIRVNVTAAGDSHSRITEIEAWGEAAAIVQSNVALASNGATASVSSMFGSTYTGSTLINNERAGVNFRTGGGWKDNTPNGWPDWVEVRFSGSKQIDRVVVYSVQNNWTAPVEPTATMTGTDYVLTNFTVQGWNGTSWVTLATVSASNLIKRTVTFAPYITDRIRINITGAQSEYSRMTEVEAWGS